jgi:hypothetical protein
MPGQGTLSKRPLNEVDYFFIRHAGVRSLTDSFVQPINYFLTDSMPNATTDGITDRLTAFWIHVS